MAFEGIIRGPSTTSFPDLAVGVLVSGFRLFSMTPRTTPSSPTMPSPSRSEKLLRDALLRDERERQHRSSPPLPATQPTHRRRHTLTPTSSYSSSIYKEDYACGSSLHTAMDVPSPYKTGTAKSSPNVTPSRIPVRNQTHRKKEGGLEMRMPTQGHAAAIAGRRKEMEPPRSSDFPSRRRHNNNTDGHSSASTESCSTRTSESSVSHLRIAYASGYSASHSSLEVVSAPSQLPPHFSVGRHLVQQSPPNPPSPSPSTKHFNARKASTQCRAIEGYVSFASVEGLGEPPLVGDEDGFGEDGWGKGNGENGRMGAVTFLPLGVLSAALKWKKFVGGAGPGISHGLEGKDQGVVV